MLSLWGPDGQSLKSLFTILGFLAIGLGFLGSPQIFVRFLSLRSVDEVKPGAGVAVVWTLLATFSAVLIGMIGRAVLLEPAQVLPDVLGQGGQDVLPLLVVKAVPEWVAGIYIAIVLAAIMSTVDSLLVLASSAFVRDYYQKVRHPEMSDEQLLGRSRTVTFVLAGIALCIAFSGERDPRPARDLALRAVPRARLRRGRAVARVEHGAHVRSGARARNGRAARHRVP